MSQNNGGIKSRLGGKLAWNIVLLFVATIMLSSAATAGLASAASAPAHAGSPTTTARASPTPSTSGTTLVLQQANIAFTGSVQTDFSGDLLYHNYNTTQWGPNNNITGLYAAYNGTELFLGLNATADGNSVMFFLSNDTNSGLGTTNLTNYSAWTGHDFNFTTPINYEAAVAVSGANSGPSGQQAARITSAVSASGTAGQTDVAINNTWDISTSGYELAINWSGLFPAGVRGPADLHLSVFVAGGGAWVGMGAPYLQAGAYNAGGTQPYFLVNNTFSLEAPDAIQHTTILNNESVSLTGNVPADFSGDLLYANTNTTPWGAGNNITGLYAAYNATDLFIGLNATATGNSVMIFLSNETSSPLGSTNITGLSAWSGHNINFTNPINYEAAVYSANLNANQSGALAARVTSNVTASDSTNQNFVLIQNTWAFGPSGYEVAINWSGLYPSGINGPAGLQISAFVAGGGAWVGMGAPFPQVGKYNNGGAQVNFVVNDTLSILTPNLNVPTSQAPPSYPISVDLIFNDHQPFYQSINSSTAYLPWTVVHLEEYAEQAIIAGENPTVNVTYSLSGSLLYQIEAIAAGYYNNSYLQTAYIPQSQWSNSVYTEISQHGDSFLASLVGTPQWNSTNISQVIEFDLAFNTPLWVYSAAPAAAAEYNTLHNIEGSQLKNQTTMSPADLTDALVEFFLWSTSYPIISGQLGAPYGNSTMMALFGDSSFSISDLQTIASYYPVEAQLTLATFAAERMLNNNSGGNVALLTTPFDHPILPLLLLNNYTGQTGDAVVKGVWANDTVAQLNVGRDLYDQVFHQYPVGLWSPEQAVSGGVVPSINASGYTWTSSSQNTLSAAGINSGQGVSTPNASQLEALYTPYRVWGPNNTTSTVMVYRDESISNDWGFNYGGIAESGGSWAAVDTFMASLKNVYATIPTNAHNDTLVTVALDGENWMFESSFPEDAVPFLQDLYTAIAQNSSDVHSTTVQQYMATHPSLPTLTNLPTGSWNAEPSGTGINQYLGQWAGHGPQDSYWQQLTLVRSEVEAYGAANHLVQPSNLSGISPYNNYPILSGWNATTPQGKYAEAWTAIYLAEGSDYTFSWDTGDQSLSSQNAIVFENEVRADLDTALGVLGLPLTPFLTSSYIPPLTPMVWGTNSSVSPVLTGSLITTGSFAGGTGYSVNANDAWTGAYEASTGATSSGAGVINATYYAFDANNLYFSVGVKGATSNYKAPNFYVAANDSLDIFFSPVNPGAGDLQSLAIPDAAFTVGSTPFGFAATTEATIQGSSVTPSGSATMDLYQTTNAAGAWTFDTSVAGDAFVGGLLQIEIPLTDLGMVPGDSISFFVAAVNSTSGAAVSSIGPLIVTVPGALAVLTLISTIHNTAPSDGPGDYTYPTEAIAGVPDYPPGSVDMQWVNVSDNNYIVQFNITFGNLSNVFNGPYGFTQPIIDIYIHEPGASGKTASLPGVNINLSKDSAWAYVIQAAGWSANSYVESAAGVSTATAVRVTTNEPSNGTLTSDRTVSIQVPTALIGSAIPTYNYTIVAGFQDGYATNGWDVVNPTASSYQGGGAKALDAPYVFSYIAPAVVGSNPALTQEDLLSNYTNTSYPTLVAVALPLLTVTTTTTVALGGSAVVGTASGDQAFYSFGSEVYTSTSTTGSVWAAPTPWFNLSWVPTGLAAVGGSTMGWVAWNGSNYAFQDLATGQFANGTASGTIESAALTYTGGSFFLALDVAGTITIVVPGSATVLGTAPGTASAVGLATASSGTSYIAEATSTNVVVLTVTLTSTAATFGSSDVLTAALPTGAVPSGVAVAGGPTGGVAVAVAAKNATGSNIWIANGTGTGTFRSGAADGTDYSPSLVAGSGATAPPVYLGFTDRGGSGNVFFIPTSVATLSSGSTTTPPPPSSSSSIPSWVWIAIAVVVIVVILVAVVALMRRPKEPTPSTTSSETSSTTTVTESSSTTAPSEGGDSEPGAPLPPDGS
ncbi:MAG: glucodextranase DOMON-like domain-containing protein [Thermoplasmata archaeon]